MSSAKPPRGHVRHGTGALWRAMGVLLLGILWVLQAPAWAAATSTERETRLRELDSISEKDPRAALRALNNWKTLASADADVTLERNYLKTLFLVQIEAGQIAEAKATTAGLAQLAKKANDPVSTVLAGIFEATTLMESGKHNEALSRLNQLAAQSRTLGDAETQRRFHNATGTALNATGRFEQALEHELKALEYADQQPTQAKQARAEQLNALANLYLAMKSPDKALTLIDEALAICRALGLRKSQASLYLNRGYALADLDRNTEALKAYEGALRISQEIGLPATEAVTLNNIADQHLIARDYAKAVDFATRAMARAKEASSQDIYDTAQANVGLARIGQGKIAEGVAHVNKSTASYRKSGSVSSEEGLLGELSRMYEGAGLYAEALRVAREQQELSNRLFKSDQSRAVAAMQEQFDSVQRQKQLEMLGRENRLKDAELSNRLLQQLVTLLGALVAVMGGVFVWILYRKVQKANRHLKEANQKLEFHSVRDPLTGLFNRRSFLDLMNRRADETAGGRRTDRQDSPNGLIIMDIDHFKQINDTWGHAAGDAVLVELAARLKATVRDSDMVMRWGGEEFLIYSPHATAAHAEQLASRLLDAVGKSPVQVGESAVPVTVSAGFITLPFSGLTESQCGWEKALQIADMALYLSKLNGRNRGVGLVRLRAPFEAAMPILERDLTAAMTQGMVEWVEVQGPVNTPALEANSHE